MSVPKGERVQKVGRDLERNAVWKVVRPKMETWYRHTRAAAVIYCHDDLRALSGLSLFRIRLRVTKRLKEFKTRRKELMESEGMTRGRATTRVCREMGYRGNELKHQRVFRSQVWVEREKERRKWLQKRRRATVKFEEAIRGLPATAPEEDPGLDRGASGNGEAYLVRGGDYLDCRGRDGGSARICAV